MQLGEKIRQRRVQLGLSQHELAQRTGIPQSRISELESGTRSQMSLKNLRNMARALQISADDLLGTWEDEEEPVQMGVGAALKGR